MNIDSIKITRASTVGGDCVFVQLTSGAAIGYGEVCLGREPIDSAEWGGSAFTCLRDFLAPAVRGRSIKTADELQTLLARFQGNAAAKFAIDSAWWNLKAAVEGKSIAQLLGASEPSSGNSVTFGVMESPEDLLRAIESVRETASLVILKFRPGWDEAMLRGVRQIYPTLPLAIDCDGLCRLSQRDMFYRLEDFMLRWIEQPLAADDLVGHAMLQENLRTPICLDQSITTEARLEQAIDLGSCRMVKLDPRQTGGITPTLPLIATCHQAGIPVAIAGQHATRGGGETLAALAGVAGCSLPSEIRGEIGEIAALVDEAVDRAVI